MTLSFSSFSIKDILTGLDANGKPGTAGEFCETKANNTRTGYGGRGGNQVYPETLPTHPRVISAQSEVSTEEDTGEESELIEGGFFFNICKEYREKNLKLVCRRSHLNYIAQSIMLKEHKHSSQNSNVFHAIITLSSYLFCVRNRFHNRKKSRYRVFKLKNCVLFPP